MSDETLRSKAREAIRSERIPTGCPRTIRKSAVDACCAVCGVTVGELGLALEFVRERVALEQAVHIDCFAAWELERGGTAVAKRVVDAGGHAGGG
jgi:hypothetical protein